MKIRNMFGTIILTLLAGIAYAGLTQPAPVLIDFDNMTALGDQLTARTAPDDTSFIGCGTRHFDDGMGNSFRFGFCQAGDADGNTITCFTENPNLLDEMRGNSSYGFVTFSWDDDGTGNLTCNRVGFSTQSFYLPEPLGADFENHTHDYLTGEGAGHNNTPASTSPPNEGE